MRTSLLAAISVVLAVVPAAQCELARLVASDAQTRDLFGLSASVSGHRAVFGAPSADPLGADSGAAYVFEFKGSAGWVETAKLVPSDGLAADQFGYAVEIDADTIFVGAPAHDSFSTNAGAIYVFDWNGSTWVETTKLVPTVPFSLAALGESVDHAGGILVGGARHDATIGIGSGAAEVYELVAGTWTPISKLIGSDTQPGDSFGSSVAVGQGPLGDVVVIGAYAHDAGTTDSGAAYVFERSGLNWTETAKLLPADPNPADFFGSGVATNGDDILVGAMYADTLGVDEGAVYEFRRSGPGWAQSAKIFSSDSANFDRFGWSLAVEGTRMIVGAYGRSDLGMLGGAAYVFDLVGGSWVETAKLLPNGGVTRDIYGFAVDVDGDIAAVGAFRQDSGALDGGAGYMHQLDMPTCGKLVAVPRDISVTTGGTQTLGLNAGVADAGRLYFVLGSGSGTTPGLTIGAVTLPLNPDAWFNKTLIAPNVPPLAGFFASLDSNGAATASISIPGGAFPGLVGITLHHAFAVLDLSLPTFMSSASNSDDIVLVP